METLLSVAFDYLASFDGPKIKKGLRQIEGLLAQVCISAHEAAARKKGLSSATNSPNKSPVLDQHQHHLHNDHGKKSARPKYALADLTTDAAFQEFFKLQDGFQWNIATRLIQTLDKLYAKSDDGSLDLLMLSALDSLQGCLLLHPPSRQLFSRTQNMNLLLDLLEPINCPAIQSATLQVLVVALLETPQNTRTFEQLDGLLTVSSIFKSRATARDVKFKTMEFLYFYLMPETPSIPRAGEEWNLLQRSSSELGRAFAAKPGMGGNNNGHRNGSGDPFSSSSSSLGDAAEADGGDTLSCQRKQDMLGQHLSNVADLVKDLEQYTPGVVGK